MAAGAYVLLAGPEVARPFSATLLQTLNDSPARDLRSCAAPPRPALRKRPEVRTFPFGSLLGKVRLRTLAKVPIPSAVPFFCAGCLHPCERKRSSEPRSETGCAFLNLVASLVFGVVPRNRKEESLSHCSGGSLALANKIENKRESGRRGVIEGL